MKEIQNDFDKICSPYLIIQYKNHFNEEKVDFWAEKFTLKTENVKFLTSLPQVFLQDVEKSFEETLWDAKNY